MRLSAKDFLDFCGGKAGQEIKDSIAQELAALTQGRFIKDAVLAAAESHLTKALKNPDHELRAQLMRITSQALNAPESVRELLLKALMNERYSLERLDNQARASFERVINQYLAANPDLVRELIAERLGLKK